MQSHHAEKHKFLYVEIVVENVGLELAKETRRALQLAAAVPCHVSGGREGRHAGQAINSVQ